MYSYNLFLNTFDSKKSFWCFTGKNDFDLYFIMWHMKIVNCQGMMYTIWCNIIVRIAVHFLIVAIPHYIVYRSGCFTLKCNTFTFLALFIWKWFYEDNWGLWKIKLQVSFTADFCSSLVIPDLARVDCYGTSSRLVFIIIHCELPCHWLASSSPTYHFGIYILKEKQSNPHLLQCACKWMLTFIMTHIPLTSILASDLTCSESSAVYIPESAAWMLCTVSLLMPYGISIMVYLLLATIGRLFIIHVTLVDAGITVHSNVTSSPSLPLRLFRGERKDTQGAGIVDNIDLLKRKLQWTFV